MVVVVVAAVVVVVVVVVVVLFVVVLLLIAILPTVLHHGRAANIRYCFWPAVLFLNVFHFNKSYFFFAVVNGHLTSKTVKSIWGLLKDSGHQDQCKSCDVLFQAAIKLPGRMSVTLGIVYVAIAAAHVVIVVVDTVVAQQRHQQQ